MARTRSGSSSVYMTRGETWLEGAGAAAIRLLWRAIGGCMVVSVLLLAISMISYTPMDPSWNTASTPDSVQNWMGKNGAYLSDFILQSIGLGGAIPALFISYIYGVRLWKDHEGDEDKIAIRQGGKLLSFALCVLCASIAGARVPSFEYVPQPYLGGAIGMMVLNALSGPVQSYVGVWVHTVIALAMAGVSFTAGCYAAGVTVRSALTRIVAAALWLVDMGSYAYVYVGYIYAKWRDPNGYTERAERIPPRRRRQAIRDEDADEDEDSAQDDDFDDDSEWIEDEDDEEDGFERLDVSEIKVIRPAAVKSKKKKQTHQLELGQQPASDFTLPDIDFLQVAPPLADSDKIDEDALRKNADMLQTVLGDYHVRGNIMSIHPGPVVTLYELEPAPGTKSSRVIGLANDIARSMAAVSVRAAVVPGRNVIGIELPNKRRQTVYLRDLLLSESYAGTGAKLPLVLGKDIGGHPVIADLARMPHLLVAGTTGSGKSVAINTMILSLLYRMTPEQCRFIMIDPKMLELSAYDDIPHLLTPVVTEPGKAIVALKWAVQEMENRYRAMSKLGVRNIEGYNVRLAEARSSGESLMRKVQTGFDPETGQPIYEEQPLDLTDLPYIVIIVDEFADLMLVAGKDVENAIQRLAQMARAAGIHLIMATQRPSVDVITGVIKANFPTRISFQVTSKIDSRTILGEGGAEQLLGMGDMLFMAPGGRLTRVHGPFVSDDEVLQVVTHLKAQGTPEYLDDVTEGDDVFGEDGEFGGGDDAVDEFYDRAVALVSREGKASTSFVQRHLQIGYNRAARIIEEMERQGVISTPSHSGKREVLIGDHSGRH
jgi:S-DNA-T family DNA segregation ATPase FtsK/SpoIIIE